MQPEETTRTLDTIRTFDHELRERSQHVKALKEQLQEIVESTDEYAVVESLKGQLKAAKEKLKYKLLGMATYTNLAEKLADEKASKRSTETDISDFLVAYHAETKERQVELQPGDAREVILKGRLGKPKDYQLNLLTQGGDNEQTNRS